MSFPYPDSLIWTLLWRSSKIMLASFKTASERTPDEMMEQGCEDHRTIEQMCKEEFDRRNVSLLEGDTFEGMAGHITHEIGTGLLLMMMGHLTEERFLASFVHSAAGDNLKYDEASDSFVDI